MTNNLPNPSQTPSPKLKHRLLPTPQPKQKIPSQLITANNQRLKLANSYEAKLKLQYELELALTEQVACLAFHAAQLEKRLQEMEMAREYFLDQVERVEKGRGEKMSRLWEDALQTLKFSSSASVKESPSSQTELDVDMKVKGPNLQDDTHSGDGSVDEEIWDRNVDPMCMDFGSESDGGTIDGDI
ncbi:hypothetical protein DL98DRAFT_602093 [Cadophora sp. DSE1049]|nr:hypothetical protein DL98DRAFT_602093 [Cadophora sp. DSE1049]